MGQHVATPGDQTVTAAAFEEALPLLRPEVHRYCSRMAGSVIEGEDILQIALMKAFEALKRGDQVADLRAWVFRIAHNTALDCLRATRRESDMIASTKEDQANRPSMPERSEVADSLRPFLALPARQRSTVIFRDVFGYTTGEVAELTESTVASVKAALHRGRAALRQSAAPAEPAPLSDTDKQRLTLYAQLFNDRSFDRLRDMLAAEVRLELVGRARGEGRRQVGNYFGNYDRAHDWLLAPGLVEGRPAMLVFDPEDPARGPDYFVLLDFADDALSVIRDFRYARYAMAEAEWQRLG